MKYTNIIIEGIDRIGKDTVINELTKYFNNIHDKPNIIVQHTSGPGNAKRKLLVQFIKYNGGFNLMKHNEDNILIFNRFHLGEFVYGKRYRNLTEDDLGIINHLDQEFCKENILMILLTTSSFNHIKDDGLSIDFDQKENEQLDFINAFNNSHLDKIMIDTYDKNTDFYKKPSVILNEILDKVSHL